MIKLSDSFTYKRLMKFTAPSIFMMIFTSVYGVVDGYFVSNFVGKTSFAAVNFIMPFLMILGALGFMFGTGGSALCAKYMGEGNIKKANSVFSLIVYISLFTGIVISLMGYIFLEPVARFLGAQGKLLSDCVFYGRIIIAANPFFILQMEFQSFFITAEKPKMGLLITVISGCTNIVLDFLFVGLFKFGIYGAAWATATSQIVGGVIPLIYFMNKGRSILKLGKAEFDGGAIIKTCTNGSSELMTNISLSFVNMVYNIQLLKYAGENGVAAYGVLMYVNFIFISTFIGYSIGSAPIVSFHYGAKNSIEIKSLLKKSFVIISLFSMGMFVFSNIIVYPLSEIFTGYDKDLFDMTCHAMKLFSFSFLFAGFSIYISAFFTALNDGASSALVSFLRTLVFQLSAVLILPVFLKLDGIWISVAVGEFVAALFGIMILIRKKQKYNY